MKIRRHTPGIVELKGPSGKGTFIINYTIFKEPSKLIHFVFKFILWDFAIIVWKQRFLTRPMDLER